MEENYISALAKKDVIAFVPAGNSMWPFLHNKKQSVIVQKKENRLKKYDVALYERENDVVVLHRVMEVLPDGYVMCGDSQFQLEKVKEENVHGIMTGFYVGKKFIDTEDKTYRKKVDKWYSHTFRRKLRLKVFFFDQRVKAKLKSIFCKGAK